jgi:hypothetical protein
MAALKMKDKSNKTVGVMSLMFLTPNVTDQPRRFLASAGWAC